MEPYHDKWENSCAIAFQHIALDRLFLRKPGGHKKNKKATRVGWLKILATGGPSIPPPKGQVALRRRVAPVLPFRWSV
jgi:hypothetical protein